MNFDHAHGRHHPRISIFTLSLLKIRPVFLMFPNVRLLISRRWKKISTNGFHHCKLHPWETLNFEYEQNRMTLKYWKIVANEKCTAEIVEFSSVKTLSWYKIYGCFSSFFFLPYFIYGTKISYSTFWFFLTKIWTISKNSRYNFFVSPICVTRPNSSSS